MLQSKNVTKVLSLLIAIVLWAYVIAVENPPTTERIANIPVELRNVGMLTQNGLAILEGENAMVEVVVTGTRSDISKYKDQVGATANVFGYGIGENYVTVEVLMPAQLSRPEVRPSRILVNIENLVSVYRPVSLTFTGEAEPGTEPGNLTVQPEQIEVKGPKSLVESVAYVGVEVDYSEISRMGSTLTCVASALDADGNVVPKVELSSETVSVKATMFNTKTVPLSVDITGEVSGIFEVTGIEVPPTIKIRGPRNSLAEIASVKGEPIDISSVDTTSELRIHPVLPDGVEIADDSRGLNVKIGIKGITKSSLEYFSPEIEILGLPESLGAYINTPSLMLNIAGKEAVVEQAGKDDFVLTVDVEGLEEGTHVVQVSVVHDVALNSLELIPEEVHITINAVTVNEKEIDEEINEEGER
ncbi:MAG: CdaR family protein [Clostridiales bacterium]|nr:CdaR family protein [Clostridiales bacterium]